MTNTGRQVSLQHFMLLLVFGLAISQSVGYLIPGLQPFTRSMKYTGLSPNAIAFVHPSFFSPKEVRLHFGETFVKINPLTHDEYFTNRSSYRALMFTFDSNKQDVERSLKHTFCRSLDGDGRVPTSVEYFLFQSGKTKRLRLECLQ